MDRLITLLVLTLASIAMSCAAHAQAPLPPFPGKNVGIYGKSTGFFHVEQVGGKWWVIDPAGNAFFIIGTDHVNYNVHWCEALGYAPYHKNCEAIYGDEQKWADHAVELLRSWGFNSLGANNSPTTRRRGLAHLEFLGWGQGFAGEDYITVKTTWTGFPNVFSPKWAEYCDRKAAEQCPPNKPDMWLIGYFIDNELEWYGKTGSLFSDAFARPADHTAKIALVNQLRKRYKDDIQAFNKVWGTQAASFDELLRFTTAPKSSSQEAADDVSAFAKLCADRYFSVASAAIRKHDPNHMVLGCRFAGNSPGVWSVAGKYCDIVSVNCYRTLDLDKGVMTDDFETDLANWHEKTGRPLMITEWSFPGLDAGLPSVHGAGQRVKTQADRARAFTIFQRLLFSTPFLVGSNYFMWVDEPALGIAKTFPEDSNYGLVNEKDVPYKPITEAATKLHARAYDIHRGNVADMYVKPTAKHGTFTVGNSGKATAKCKVFTWVDGNPSERTATLVGGSSQQLDILQGQALRPGGHLLMCRAESDDPLVEPNPADNEAHDLFYVAEKIPGGGIPVLVANLTDRNMDNVPIVIKLSDLRTTGGITTSIASLYWEKYGSFTELHSQVIGDEAIISTLDGLLARHCAVVYVRKGVQPEERPETTVVAQRKGNLLDVANGPFRLIRAYENSGNAFDRVEHKGTEVGSFTPMVQQWAGQDFWVRPDGVEDVQVQKGPVAVVLDMTFRYNGGGDTANRPHKYRAAYRFIAHEGQHYFTSRCLWIENTDTEPWKLQSYFHCPFSNIAGDSSDDKPRPGYWLDEKAKLCYGVARPNGFRVSFWKGQAGEEHADVYRWPTLEKVLKPGERFTPDDEPVYIIAGDEEGFERISRQVGPTSGLLIQVQPAQ